MNRLAAVVEGVRPPGVYRWLSRAHPEPVRREMAARGWSVHLVDGRTVSSAANLFDRCAEVLAFPAWFGHNWDALADCLGDLSWLPGQGHVVVWDQYGVLARTDPKAWALAFGVFATAVEARVQAAEPPLYLLLRGAGPVEVPERTDPIPTL